MLLTNRERIEAFRMRLQGMTWEEIGDEIGYTADTVYRELSYIMKNAYTKPCAYPYLQRLIEDKFGGSISAFCASIDGTSPSFYFRFLRMLRGKTKPNKADIDMILESIGASYEEVFGNDSV